MCGIVGYYGPKNPKDVIISGLKALEYRGYDSAGVAIMHSGHFKRVRAEGKLSALEEKLSTENFDGHLGIGHTRWATHGAPVERNAHPHTVDGISLVHNGIIENYAELKAELGGNTQLTSDTDTELIAHLIAKEVRSGKKLLAAVVAVLPKLSGAYSVLVVSEDSPDEMVAFKNGPPLLVGLAEHVAIVASDAQAIVNYTKNVIYLDDFEIAHIKKAQVSFYDKTGKHVVKKPSVIDWTEERAEKQGFAHFMLKEIFEQPRAVARALGPHIDTATHTVNLKDVGLELDVFKNLEKIYIIACGTSFYAGMTGKYLIENFARVPVEIDIASEFRYRKPVISKNSLAIFISQSGETADTLAALRMLKEQKVPTLSVCNVKKSTIDREADGHLYMNSGVEVGVASTKAFSSSLAIMNVMALYLAKVKGQLNRDSESTYVKGLLSAPSHMENILSCNKFFAEAAEVLARYKGFLYLGRGLSFPIALEGALKLKELAYKHAEGYAAGEMKHGPLALIDKNMAVVVLAPKNELYEKTVSNLEEAKARGGQIIAIGTGQDEKLKSLSVHYLALPKADTHIYPLLEVIPLQLLAYHVASALGNDVDQPRNLAKSVTVE
jgi:glucosamine--fructose-6-phosphate aminotransferase (isomerizing)